MKLKVIEVGRLYVNCYVCYDDATGEAVIIDPGDEAGRISELIEQNNMKPIALLMTHSHFDHVCAVSELRDKYEIPAVIFKDEERLLENEEGNVARPFRTEPVRITPDILLEDNQRYAPFSNGEGFLVLHTPGHTEGGASYYSEELSAVFTGDTLFRMSVGRSDFPTGNHERLITSIKDRLLPLGDNITVYPGHGSASNIKDERERNPFLV